MSDGEALGAVRSGHASVPILGWVAIGAVAYFAHALIVLHVLRPDVDPMARVTSEYAVGAWGVLMTSAYFVLALALVALGVGLSRALEEPARSTAGIVLLFIAALGTATAGLFPVDVGAPRPVTPTGWVHRVAAIVAFASMTLGPLLLARVFSPRPGWRDLAGVSTAVGALGLLGLAAIQLFLLERGLAGAAQRVVLMLVVGWMLAVALRLGAAAGQEERTS